MPYSIEVTPGAERQIRRLPRQAQPEVRVLIRSLADNPRPDGVVKLTDAGGLYPVRAGDYRVLYLIEDERLAVVVVRVANRREVY